MSQITNVQATTVTQTDYNANIDKFYTTYALGPYEIRQWGRVGVIGQFSIEKHSSASAAASSARTQIDKKERGGYTDSRVDLTFQFDIDKLGTNPGKDQAKWVAHAKDAYVAGGGAPAAAVRRKTGAPSAPLTTTISTPVRHDRFEVFTSKALGAITLAVTDPAQASVTYAILNKEWVELQAVTEKAQSYLSTLDSLLNASMS